MCSNQTERAIIRDRAENDWRVSDSNVVSPQQLSNDLNVDHAPLGWVSAIIM